MNKQIICLVVVGVMLMAVVRIEAQERERPRDMIEAYRIWKLTDVLDLSEEQMPAFFAKLRKIEEANASLRRDEHQALRDIAGLLDKEDVAEADLEKALDEYEKMRVEHFEEMKRLRREAASLLSLKQRCQYVVFEERFRSELREMIGRAREMRRGERMDEGGQFRRPRSH